MTEAQQKILDAIVADGLAVSFVYGRTGANGVWWSVTVLNEKTGEGFAKPFAANSIGHAVEIAAIECHRRGWYKQ